LICSLLALVLLQSRPELLAEVERAGRSEPLKAIDTLRFQLPAPQSGLKASEAEWAKAVDNAATQLMHQEGRLTNLELLKRYGGEYAMTTSQEMRVSSRQTRLTMYLTCPAPHSESLASA
jgi:pre-mRNA-splicing factor SPF27